MNPIVKKKNYVAYISLRCAGAEAITLKEGKVK